MSNKRRTLELLRNNYHPFTYFSDDMLNKVGNSLRIFEVRAGESLTIQATSDEDALFVTQGSANIQLDKGGVFSIASSEKQALTFSLKQSPISISTDVRTTVCHADSALLNDFISLQEISNTAEVVDQDSFLQKLMFLKSTAVFRLLPINVVEEAAKRCSEIDVESKQEVIRQDMKADNFYIILEGEAEVWREELEDDEPQLVAILGSGDSFGEEALVMGGARNATVQMKSDGRLLKLAKEDFEELVSAPAIRSVTAEVAKVMMKDGAQIIDVRFEEEYQESFIPGSVLMPLPELRLHIPELEKSKDYLILCAAGVRAAAATLLLRQKDIKASFIEGGIKAWPFDTVKSLDLELILFDFCPYAQRAVISLNENNIEHKLTYLDPDNLPDWFAEISPFGKVPILRVDGKTTVFESSVINELIGQISSSQMLPSDPVERSLCRSWTEFASTLLGQVTGMLALQEADEFISARDEFLTNLLRLEQQLEGRGPLFTGDKFSLVDSTYAPLFMRMRKLNEVVDLYKEEDFPLISSWSKKLLDMNSVVDSIPKSFNDIYTDFVKRRGENGYIDQCFSS
ncbi:MAG: cyclic nucleotide-binding domain-containing protein [Cocleimonas sp.]